MSPGATGRRQFIKHAAAGSLALGLAACTGKGAGPAGSRPVKSYRVETDDRRGIDFLVNETDRSRVMVRRFGCEVVGYRIADPSGRGEIPLMYRDSLLEPPESGWRGHATVMFPVVGGLKDDRSRVGARTIELGGHGFARHSKFDLVETSVSGRALARYRLTPDEQTRRSYPFAFRLDLVYALEDNRLSLTFDVGNPGGEPACFCLGWHPGFRTPVIPGLGRKTDCSLVLPPGQITRYQHNEFCRLTGETGTVRTCVPLAWTEEELEGTLLFGVDDPALRTVVLKDPASGISIRMDFRDFAHLGLWSEPGREFICIEPSQGMDDSEEQEPFDEKIGVVKLEPGGRDVRTATVSPETG